jgi:hypothetical protein
LVRDDGGDVFEPSPAFVKQELERGMRPLARLAIRFFHCEHTVPKKGNMLIFVQPTA